ncbi:hypothetical protein, partial [Hymenobacter saemangeumensis]|uniref:hypothetical protein n=1 Tax=Hymenobacter saemangeumensis TaxID=1084522 RepID=UPI0031E879D2
NLFDDGGAGPADMLNVEVQNTDPTFRQLGSQWYHPSYSVFHTLYNNSTNYPNPLIYSGLDLADGGRNINTIDGECVNVFPGAGIPRPAAKEATTMTTQPFLAQNHPNPASESTTFTYQLPAAAKSAAIVVRRGTDGYELIRLSLAVNKTTRDLDLRGYQPGVYFATLLIDGMPVQTRRVLVQ